MTSTIKAHITFISAGAGSGKTHRLTELLHSELTTGDVRPSGVIATTFTKKAATELRERVREHLLKQGSFGLANAMGQARVGTVNSVCGQLIARFAFEAGMSTEQQVLEEVQGGILLGRAIDAVLDGPGMSELLSLVRRLGLEPDVSDKYKDNWRDDLKSLVDQIRSNDIPLSQVPGFAQANADDLLGHFPSPAGQDFDTDLLNAIWSALLDFADQEHQLLGLLDHPEVASVLDEELDLLMVDEFQDTSPIQLALFLKLTRFAKKVYWVGDIKQAVYGFRGSDTELMQATFRRRSAATQPVAIREVRYLCRSPKSTIPIRLCSSTWMEKRWAASVNTGYGKRHSRCNGKHPIADSLRSSARACVD